MRLLRAPAMAVALTMLLAAGCLTNREPLHLSTYIISPDPPVDVMGETGGPALAMRAFEPVRIYSTTRMVYRKGEYEVDVRKDGEWAEMPSDAVHRALHDALTRSRVFSDVGPALNVKASGLVLTGQLRRFDEDRSQSPPQAVVEIRLDLRSDGDGRLLWTGVAAARAPVEGPHPSDLAAAMTRAVESAVADAVTHIAQAVMK